MRLSRAACSAGDAKPLQRYTTYSTHMVAAGGFGGSGRTSSVDCQRVLHREGRGMVE